MRRHGRGRDASAGFTMIEIMVVIAILSLLISMVLYAASTHRKTARIEATKSLIQRIEVFLQEYHNLTNGYPPDGFDFEVTNDDGVPIRGSACIYHFLSKEFEIVKNVAGEERRTTHAPLMDFRTDAELQEDKENPGVFEVIDAFGYPLHYDNTENGKFEPQTGDAHMPPEDRHPPDPREDVEFGSVTREGLQGQGYDVWSHGEYGHNTDVAPETALPLTIANWNLDIEATRGEDK